MRALATVALAGLIATAASPAIASEKKVEEYLQAFWTSALWQDPVKTGANTSPIGLSKFPEGAKLRISVSGNMGNAYRGMVLSQTGPVLASARIDHEILPAGDEKDANVQLRFITFLPNVNFDAACVTRRTPRLGATKSATLASSGPRTTATRSSATSITTPTSPRSTA